MLILSALSFFQCFDIIGWFNACKKPVTLVPKGSVLKTDKEENQVNSSDSPKKGHKTQVVVVAVIICGETRAAFRKKSGIVCF